MHLMYTLIVFLQRIIAVEIHPWVFTFSSAFRGVHYGEHKHPNPPPPPFTYY